jgi:hypothetical protein
MRRTQYVVLLTVVAALSATAADDTAERLGQATTVFNKLTASGHGIGPERSPVPTVSLSFADLRKAP